MNDYERKMLSSFLLLWCCFRMTTPFLEWVNVWIWKSRVYQWRNRGPYSQIKVEKTHFSLLSIGIGRVIFVQTFPSPFVKFTYFCCCSTWRVSKHGLSLWQCWCWGQIHLNDNNKELKVVTPKNMAESKNKTFFINTYFEALFLLMAGECFGILTNCGIFWYSSMLSPSIVLTPLSFSKTKISITMPMLNREKKMPFFYFELLISIYSSAFSEC